MDNSSRSHSIFYYVGNLVILSAVLLFIFIFYPVIQIYAAPVELKSLISDQDYFITIPKISAQAPVISDVNPWEKSDYESALQHGVAEASGFAKPGQKGPIFLFAHSSLDPWQMTRTNTAFLKLNQLENGDKIIINRYGQLYSYQVVNKKEIYPEQVSELKIKDDVLILQTCTPLGTSLKRLLIFAKQIN